MSTCCPSERLVPSLTGPRDAVWIVTLSLAFMLTGLAGAGTVSHGRNTLDLRGGDRINVKTAEDKVVVHHADSTVDSVNSNAEDLDVRLHGDVLRKGLRVDVDDGQTGIVRMFSDVTIPADQHVDGDVVALCGNVTVKGQVSGATVAVLGSIRLDPGARVDGDAVSVGGGVDQADGAEVSGQTVSVGLTPLSWGLPGLSVMLGFTFAGWLSALFFGWLFALMFPTAFVRVAATASRRTAGSFFLGLASLPLAMFAFVLLIVTVIGVPIALLLPLAYGLMIYAGQIAATYLLGCKFTARRPGDGRGLVLPLTVGLSFVAVFFVAGSLLGALPGGWRIGAVFFSLLGVLLVVALSSIGTGAFLLSRLGRIPADVLHGGDPRAVPLPPAAPVGMAPPAPTGA